MYKQLLILITAMILFKSSLAVDEACGFREIKSNSTDLYPNPFFFKKSDNNDKGFGNVLFSSTNNTTIINIQGLDRKRRDKNYENVEKIINNSILESSISCSSSHSMDEKKIFTLGTEKSYFNDMSCSAKKICDFFLLEEGDIEEIEKEIYLLKEYLIPLRDFIVYLSSKCFVEEILCSYFFDHCVISIKHLSDFKKDYTEDKRILFSEIAKLLKLNIANFIKEFYKLKDEFTLAAAKYIGEYRKEQDKQE